MKTSILKGALAGLAFVSTLAFAAGPGPGPGPGPTPDPWGVAYPDIYYNNGGVRIPYNVPGGGMGVGSINVEQLFVNGQQLQVFGGVTPPIQYINGILSITQNGITSNLLATGAAAANVGTLGGGLLGTLPNPTLAPPTPTTLGGIRSITAQAHQWVKSIAAGTGIATQSQPDASDVTFTPAETGGTQTVLNTWMDRTRNPDDFGAFHDGVNDDTGAITEAAQSLGITGGVVQLTCGNQYRLKTNLNLSTAVGGNVNPSVVLQGCLSQPDDPGTFSGMTGSVNTYGGLLRDPGATINIGRNGGLQNIAVIQTGVTLQQETASNFSGTAVTQMPNGYGQAVLMKNVFIMGGNLCYDGSNGGARVHLDGVMCDGVNGMIYGQSPDSSYINNIHVYPYATESFPGYAVTSVVGDGTTTTVTFVPGIYYPPVGEGVVLSGVTFTSGGANAYPNPTGSKYAYPITSRTATTLTFASTVNTTTNPVTLTSPRVIDYNQSFLRLGNGHQTTNASDDTHFGVMFDFGHSVGFDFESHGIINADHIWTDNNLNGGIVTNNLAQSNFNSVFIAGIGGTSWTSEGTSNINVGNLNIITGSFDCVAVSGGYFNVANLNASNCTDYALNIGSGALGVHVGHLLTTGTPKPIAPGVTTDKLQIDHIQTDLSAGVSLYQGVQRSAPSIASAGTINLPATSSVGPENYELTGTTTINTISGSWGYRRIALRSDSGLTLTNAGNIVLNGLSSLNIAAGQTVELIGDNAGHFYLLNSAGSSSGGSAGETITTTGGTINLTSSDLSYAVINLTGTLTSAVIVNYPSGTKGLYTLVNNTTGAFTVTAGITGQTTFLAIPDGQPRQLSSGDGVTMTSPISQASNLATPSTTVNGDLPTWSGTSGAALADSGYGIGTSGNSLCPANGNCILSGFHTFNAGTNVGQVGSMLINGDMDIDQISEGQLNLSGLDRWAYTYTTYGGVTMQRSGITPAGYSHSLNVIGPATGFSAPASTDIRRLRQSIEGAMAAPLNWGTTLGVGQPATVTFQEVCNFTGVQTISMSNSVPNYSYVHNYTIASANVWQQVQFTIPAPPNTSPWAGWGPNILAAYLNFDIGSGSNYATSSLDQWLSGDFETSTTTVPISGANGRSCWITGVHMLPGNPTGSYLPRPYPDELKLAQRYIRKTFPDGTAPAQTGGINGALCSRSPAAASYVDWKFGRDMYQGNASPTITTYNPAAANASARDVTGSADVPVTVNPTSQNGAEGLQIGSTGTVSTAGHDVCVHVLINTGF